MQGGAVQGIGYALTEELVIEDGRLLNPNLALYKLPTTLEAPNVRTIIVEHASEHGPYGAKGVGEPPVILAARRHRQRPRRRHRRAGADDAVHAGAGAARRSARARRRSPRASIRASTVRSPPATTTCEPGLTEGSLRRGLLSQTTSRAGV